MKAKESVPLKKVVQSVLGNAKSLKYLHGLDFAFVDSNDIYQGALQNLLNGKTEKALKCIIFGLDLDRDNNSIIHLAKTMLYSLSEDFYENGGEMYKQKYSNFEKTIEQLTQKIKKFKKEQGKLQEELEILEEEFEKLTKGFFLFFIFKKSKALKQIQDLKMKANKLNTEVSINEEELENLTSLAKIEEYSKILSIVMEVCIFPSRFNWVFN